MHILTSQNAPWCAWMMLLLLLCGILGEWFQPGVISQAHTALVVRNDRIYKEAPVNFMGQLLISLFRIGTLAMALWLCLTPESHYSFAAFWAVSGMMLVLLVVKMLCNWLLDFTFMLTRRFGAPYEHYGNLFTLMALVLYPTLLVLLRFSSPVATRWIVGIIALVCILVWIYRMIRTYITSPMAMVYLLLYICTLEILPSI